MDISQLMKQAQQIQTKLSDAKNKLIATEVVGTSGGGMVSITMGGQGNIKKLVIDPKLMVPEEADIVADLVIAAYNEARSKLEAKIDESMGGILPAGMKFPM